MPLFLKGSRLRADKTVAIYLIPDYGSILYLESIYPKLASLKDFK
jgi:hypothetical protein